MKTIHLIASALLALPMALQAHCPAHKMEDSKKQAVEEKKDLLMVFSGSSWNNRSKKFDEEVLNVEDFKKGIAEKFVPVVFDFPAKREDAHDHLLELQQKYRLRQMPSIILADAEGRPYAYTGVRQGTVADYLKHLDELHAIRVEFDRRVAEAKTKEGMERAKLLVEGLKKLPQDMVREFYENELIDLADADPKGETGYIAEIEKAEALHQEQARYELLFKNKEYDRILSKSKEDAAKAKGVDSQRLLLYGIRALADQKKYDEAIKAVQEMVAVDPESDLGQRGPRYEKMLSAAKTRDEEMAKNGGVAKPQRPAGPIVSKPVAVVTNIEELRKDAEAINAELAAAGVKVGELKGKTGEVSRKLEALEKEVKEARAREKELSEALKKAEEEKEALARKSEAMRDVIANHEAMEKRKREVAELEKKAAELQKQADALRDQASEIKKGK